MAWATSLIALTQRRFSIHCISSGRLLSGHTRRAMLQWFQRSMPRQKVFFPLFERHAAVIVTAARALREMLAGSAQ
jgi:hypothetical protein